MHAAVDAPETGQRTLGPAGGPAMERIKDANLEVRMRIQRCEADVVTGRKHVIDQQTHPHAPIRSLQEIVEKDPSYYVVLDQVVLDVDALFRFAK